MSLFLRSKLNIYFFKKSKFILKIILEFAKGGAGLPHNDPPDFKPYKTRRYVYNHLKI